MEHKSSLYHKPLFNSRNLTVDELIVNGNTTNTGDLTVSGVISISDGVVGEPALNFISNPTTGLYTTNSNWDLNLSISGTKIVEQTPQEHHFYNTLGGVGTIISTIGGQDDGDSKLRLVANTTETYGIELGAFYNINSILFREFDMRLSSEDDKDLLIQHLG